MPSRATNLLALSAALALAALGPGCSSLGLSKPNGAAPVASTPPPAAKPSFMAKVTSWFSSDSSKSAATTPRTIDPVLDAPLALSKKTKTGPDLNVAMAHMLERNGKLNDAIEQYKKALQIDDKYLPAVEGLGHLEDRQGNLEAATAWYQRAIEIAPREGKLHNDLGLCYHRRAMLPESAKAFRKAIELQPDRPLFRNNLASVLVEMNQNSAALEQLIAANGAPVGHYNLGYLLWRKGEQAAADAEFQAALAIDPSFEAARTWVAKLHPGVEASALASRNSSASPVAIAPTGDSAGDSVGDASAAPAAQTADRRALPASNLTATAPTAAYPFAPTARAMPTVSSVAEMGSPEVAPQAGDGSNATAVVGADETTPSTPSNASPPGTSAASVNNLAPSASITPIIYPNAPAASSAAGGSSTGNAAPPADDAGPMLGPSARRSYPPPPR